MFRKINQSKYAIKEVLKEDKYMTIFIIITIISFMIFYFFTLATTTEQSLGIFIMMNGFFYSISTFFILGIIAMLFGIYAILVAFVIKNKIRNSKKRKIGGFFGVSGLVTGLFSAGCPMCGAFLFGLFGAPLALFFLPFKGLELRALALILLGFSVYLVSRSLIECRIKK